MVKEGTIKDSWVKENSHYYKKFKELVSEFEKSGI